jgi:hypothetical protein
MISKQIPTHPLHGYPFADASTVVDVTGTRSTRWRKPLDVVAAQAKTVIVALLGAVASGVSPSYFDLARRGPTTQRLGPGLSRESDSFWPLSEW